MQQTIRFLAVIALLMLSALPLSAESTAPADTAQPAPPTPEETTLTEVGQQAPDFTVATLAGGDFRLSAHRGRLVLINWFATWCPPCKEEMPHLQKEVWEKYGPEGLVMVSVAREEEADVVAPFVEKRELTWTFGLDPDRTAYAQYAEAYIPRNTLVGADGRIIFQSNGFEAEDFEAMIGMIAEVLAE